MNNRRFLFGIVSTALWISSVAYLLFRDQHGMSKMTPNDWGSFLSGAFAPLGFLWLVLGYLQQGEELKLSTKALLLQADELKNSVEQQRSLVEVSRQQIENEREASKAEQLTRINEAKPRITLLSEGGQFGSDGSSFYPIAFSNTGDTACAVEIELRYQLGQLKQLYRSPTFNRGEAHSVTVFAEHPSQIEGATIELKFTDHLGTPYLERYVVGRHSAHLESSLTLTRVEI